MQYSTAIKCSDALASKRLPIRPGDIITFAITHRKLFVVASSHQSQTREGTGQHVCGLVITKQTKNTNWYDSWIDWTGLDDVWFIERLAV